MTLGGKVVVVTGGAHGIGAALARRFAAECARMVVVADIDGSSAQKVAAEIGGFAVSVDVTQEPDVRQLVEEAIQKFGAIDLFCSNAGIFIDGGVNTPDAAWNRILDVNVMAHIYAARAVLPGMLAHGEGYLLQTVSAAGLLTSIGSAPYAVTKHAALALAEWIAITHGDEGIKVSVICPQGVRTNMLMNDPGNFLVEGSVSAEEVAEAAIRGIAEERFLILPHPEVAEYFRRKAQDYDRWLRGMRRLQRQVRGGGSGSGANGS
jgi:NAD(P)-dependent dehydrogenase (short-subunit alcohol dehydrogenase family)